MTLGFAFVGASARCDSRRSVPGDSDAVAPCSGVALDVIPRQPGARPRQASPGARRDEDEQCMTPSDEDCGGGAGRGQARREIRAASLRKATVNNSTAAAGPAGGPF